MFLSATLLASCGGLEDLSTAKLGTWGRRDPAWVGPATSEEDSRALRGTVTNDLGEPVLGAEVRIAGNADLGGPYDGDDSHRTTTDGGGHFRLDDLGGGSYALLVERYGYRGVEDVLGSAATPWPTSPLQIVLGDDPHFFRHFSPSARYGFSHEPAVARVRIDVPTIIAVSSAAVSARQAERWAVGLEQAIGSSIGSLELEVVHEQIDVLDLRGRLVRRKESKKLEVWRYAPDGFAAIAVVEAGKATLVTCTGGPEGIAPALISLVSAPSQPGRTSAAESPQPGMAMCYRMRVARRGEYELVPPG